MSKYRVLFYGTPTFSVPSLQALIDHQDYDVIAVVTQPDRRAGRGKKLTPSPVKQLATEHQIKVIQPESIKKQKKEFLTELEQLAPIDVAIVIAFGQIIPLKVLEYPQHNSLNLHASILPRWRGAAPLNRAIEAGDRETGVCLMGMEAGLDTGPVYSKSTTSITEQNAGELHDQLSELSATILKESLSKYLEGKLTAENQDHELATYAAKLTKEEEALDWKFSAQELVNKIRAFTPFPSVHSEINQKKIKIIDAQVENLENNYDKDPGEVIMVDKNSLIVATGTGSVSIKTVKPVGKQSMPINSFLAGFKISSGDKFE